MSRLLFILIVCPIILTGCTKYQYSIISSNLPETQFNEFLIDNDTIAIKYNFNGPNCPVKILIQNKLDIPLYLDWKKSALIYQDQTITYASGSSSLNLVSVGNQINWAPGISTFSAEIDGEITQSESLSFIPPHSIKNTELVKVRNDFFELPGPKKKYRTRIMTGIDTVNVLRYTFNRSESPLEFRSYLTVATDSKLTSVLHFDNEFWVSEIIQTMSTNETIMGKKAGNRFYVKKLTGFGTATALIGLIILGGLLTL